MSIFGSIMGKIFGHASAATPVTPATPSSAGGAAPAPSFNNPAPTPSSPGSVTPPTPTPAATQTAGTGQTAPASVDVATILDGLAGKSSQKLDWRHSIVDMMKLLDLDSSLSARKELAQELHYSGSSDDSAAMNIWLHKQVMQKLAANGGKVPDDLK